MSEMKFFTGAVVTKDDSRCVTVIASTRDVDRQGDIIEVAGIDLRAFKANPVILRDHDPSRPVARASSIGVVAERLQAVAAFPAAGINPDSDQTLGLIRAGVLSGVSIGFIPKKTQPLGRGGLRITESELLEFSFVAIPANAAALIIERAAAASRQGRTEPRSMEEITAQRRASQAAARVRVRELLAQIDSE